MSNPDLPFEMHLTFVGLHATDVRSFATKDNGWTYSEINGDPAFDLRAGTTVTRCYLTGYESDPKRAMQRIMEAVAAVGAPCMRMKIEFIVFDTKTGVSRMHNLHGYGQ